MSARRLVFVSLVLGGCAGASVAPSGGTRYEQLRYVPESEDPSLTLETRDLVIKVIDNTGLLAPPAKSASYFNYTRFESNEGILRRYREWLKERSQLRPR